MNHIFKRQAWQPVHTPGLLIDERADGNARPGLHLMTLKMKRAA